jgi:CRISPR-associated endoribonuclease Cas6
MHPENFNGLELARYELRLRACQPVSLPPFLGSTLRGAFGHALKRSVCIMRPPECSTCVVADQCIYPHLFETTMPKGLSHLHGYREAPRPFILAPPIFSALNGRLRQEPDAKTGQADQDASANGRLHSGSASTAGNSTRHRQQLKPGDELAFGLVLIGRAIGYLPYVVYTVSEMARRGLGFARARFELREVKRINSAGTPAELYDGSSPRLAADSPPETLGDLISVRLTRLKLQDSLRLHFITPTRIRVAGNLQFALNFDLLARNLLRRVFILSAVHGREPLQFDFHALAADASQVITQVEDLNWWDLERYSNRQKTKIKIGGFTGEMAFAGPQLSQFLPLVVAGEMLHVGAGTSFGLGRYEIV